MQQKNWIIGGALTLIMGSVFVICYNHNTGASQPSQGVSNAPEIQKLGEASYSLKDIVDEKSTPFACIFGHFTVEMVDSKYKDHKYYKLAGSGLLINSGYLHTKISTNPLVVYAVSKDSPLSNGDTLSVQCIGRNHIPYEGKEREKIDQAAALTEFYIRER